MESYQLKDSIKTKLVSSYVNKRVLFDSSIMHLSLKGLDTANNKKTDG